MEWIALSGLAGVLITAGASVYNSCAARTAAKAALASAKNVAESLKLQREEVAERKEDRRIAVAVDQALNARGKR